MSLTCEQKLNCSVLVAQWLILPPHNKKALGLRIGPDGFCVSASHVGFLHNPQTCRSGDMTTLSRPQAGTYRFTSQCITKVVTSSHSLPESAYKKFPGPFSMFVNKTQPEVTICCVCFALFIYFFKSVHSVCHSSVYTAS